MAEARWYNTALAAQFGSESVKRIDWVNDPIKVALLNEEYSPDRHNDSYFSDISSYEIEGRGYGQFTLEGKVVENNPRESEVRLKSSSNPKWTDASFSARWAVVYKATTRSTLLGYVDFGSNMKVANGTFNINWDRSGVLKIVTL